MENRGYTNTMDNTNVAVGSNPAGFTLKVESNVAANFQKLLDWKYRNLPATHRPSLQHFMQSEVVEISEKSAKYAEDAAYKILETLVFKVAKQSNRAPAEVAKEFKGFQLRD